MDPAIVLDSWREWHLLFLGLSTAGIAGWLAHVDRADAGAVVVVAGTLAVYAQYGLVGWETHPWYYLGSLAAGLVVLLLVDRT